MADIDRHLVIVTVGQKAQEAFTPRDTRSLLDKMAGVRPPHWTDNLGKATEYLKKELSNDGIILPTVLIQPSAEIPPNVFRITVGIGFNDYDVFADNYLKALEKEIRHMQIPNLTKAGVSQLFNEAIELSSKKQFHDAIDAFMKTYYLSSLIESDTVRVASLLNIAGICLLNNKLNEAYATSECAQMLVEKNDFYDPYLKFYAHKAMAYMLALAGKYKASAMLYRQAFIDIRPLNEYKYIIDALYNEVAVLLMTDLYQECANIIDQIFNLAKQTDNVDKEILLELYEIRVYIANATANELQNSLSQLQAECDRLSRSFILKAEDVILNIISRCGSQLLTFYVGSILGGNTNTYITQNNQSGFNIVVKEIFR